MRTTMAERCSMDRDSHEFTPPGLSKMGGLINAEIPKTTLFHEIFMRTGYMDRGRALCGRDRNLEVAIIRKNAE